MRDHVALVLTAATAALHVAFANRCDLFRDELYFIVCGRHPAFGYVDQPPLVSLLAAGSFVLGHQTWLVRVPCVVAAAALGRHTLFRGRSAGTISIFCSANAGNARKTCCACRNIRNGCGRIAQRRSTSE